MTHAEAVREQRLRDATIAVLGAVGEDPFREGLRDTPGRVARAWAELTEGYNEDPAMHLRRSFPPDGATGGLVIVKDIPFYSLCEHHLLPFHGTASVGYIPTDRIVGLSKIARCVKGYAKRLQVQERITEQVADAFDTELNPLAVAVVLKARHLCMEMRGVQAAGAVTVTSALRGTFQDKPSARSEVLELIG